MEKVNSKILTLSFALSGGIVGLTVHLLLQTFASSFGFLARLLDSDLFRHGIPVGIGFLLFFLLQFNSKILKWGDEVILEVRKVVWPSKKDTTAMTIVVVIMVLISSLIVSIFDIVSGKLLAYMMNNM